MTPSRKEYFERARNVRALCMECMEANSSMGEMAEGRLTIGSDSGNIGSELTRPSTRSSFCYFPGVNITPMRTKQSLTDAEREFFALVQKTGVANPYGKIRAELESQVAKYCSDQTFEPGIERATKAVKDRLAALEAQGVRRIEMLSGKDRALLESAYLFDFFYEFRKKFDEHIVEQLAAGEKTVKLSWAGDGIAHLASRGFGPERITRAFELGYQFRRAFYFINHGLAGRSPVMRKLKFDIWNNIFTHNVSLYERYLWNRMEDFSTLLLGETGTGKGAAAGAIGRAGYIAFNLKKQRFEESFTKSFISINLSSFPETLIESELFGHKKGAFTGAVENHVGMFAQCGPHGTLLLDEIGEIPHHIQIKLLHVLQDREFNPVGSHKAESFHGRVIAATNRPIDDLRKRGAFRDDFYYRLSSDIIVMPPLRRRLREDPAELDTLLNFLVTRIIGKPSPELCRMVKDVIGKNLGMDYPWYGNVRELEQCVRRVLLKRVYEGKNGAETDDIFSQLAHAMESGDIPAQRLLSGYCVLLYRRYGTYEEVARRTRLDRRTVAKYVSDWTEEDNGTKTQDFQTMSK